MQVCFKRSVQRLLGLMGTLLQQLLSVSALSVDVVPKLLPSLKHSGALRHEHTKLLSLQSGLQSITIAYPLEHIGTLWLSRRLPYAVLAYY